MRARVWSTLFRTRPPTQTTQKHQNRKVISSEARLAKQCWPRSEDAGGERSFGLQGAGVSAVLCYCGFSWRVVASLFWAMFVSCLCRASTSASVTPSIVSVLKQQVLFPDMRHHQTDLTLYSAGLTGCLQSRSCSGHRLLQQKHDSSSSLCGDITL